MAKYLYARVSSKDQNLARQLELAEKYGIPKENIFCDKISGRKKEREDYDRLKAVVVDGDEIYFPELDRIARAKYLIKDELVWFKDRGVLCRVLDVPTTLVDFPAGQEWVLELVNTILIEVMATIAEQEWEKIKKRRDDGVAAMPIDEDGYRYSSRTGRRFGRAEKRPENFAEVYARQQRGELSLKEALSLVGIGRTRWYELARETV